MSEEKPKIDLTHVQFPDVRSFQMSRSELDRKLTAINAAFDELARQRTAERRRRHAGGKDVADPEQVEE